MTKKLLLIATSKASKKFLSTISTFRGNTSTAFQPLLLHPFDNTDKILFVHKKYDSPLSITLSKSTLTFTRTFDGELLDTYEYELTYEPGRIDVDLNPIHFTVIEDMGLREMNVVVDFFACSSRKVCLSGVKYVLSVKKTETGYLFTYEDLSGQLVGPSFELKEKRHWHCENELWERATTVFKEKRVKNVSTNEMKDVVGTLHMEKQDLADIQIKKPRRVRNN